MSALDDFTRRTSSPAPTPMAGVVHEAPTAASDPLRVVTDADRRRVVREAFGWAPHGEQRPGAGDRVTVVRADDGELWVVGWQAA
jgi:hypothetical protein